MAIFISTSNSLTEMLSATAGGDRRCEISPRALAPKRSQSCRLPHGSRSDQFPQKLSNKTLAVVIARVSDAELL